MTHYCKAAIGSNPIMITKLRINYSKYGGFETID